jgi:cyclic 2,3-diphosphoglycerate synthetase
LLADLVVVTMSESPRASPDQVESVQEAIRSVTRAAPVVRTVFRPHPMGSVAGARVLFATTAPAAVSTRLATSLERDHGCEVVGTITSLADRDALRRDLLAAPDHDVLLVELKAAAVDVAARLAQQRSARVVFCDNRPVGGDLTGAIDRLLHLADTRFRTRDPR